MDYAYDNFCADFERTLVASKIYEVIFRKYANGPARWALSPSTSRLTSIITRGLIWIVDILNTRQN